MAVGRRHQQRRPADQHRFARVRVEDVGEQLLGPVDVRPVDQLVARDRVDPGGRDLVRVIARAFPLVVVGGADHDVDDPLLLVEAEDFADLRGPAQHQVGAVEENRLLGHRHDEAALRGRRRLDVVLAEAQVGIGHAGRHLLDPLGDPADARNLLTVHPRRDGVDQFRADERLLRVGLHDLRVDHLAGDIEERRHIDAVIRLQHADAAGAPRVEHPHPLAAVRHERLGQVANAEVFRLKVPLVECLGEMPHGLFGAVELVAALEFTIFHGHDRCSKLDLGSLVESSGVRCRVSGVRIALTPET